MNQVLLSDIPPRVPPGIFPVNAEPPGARIAALPGTTIKVLIADDHPFVRGGIKQCINDSLGMTVVGEAGTALDVFNFLGRAKCDVLVLDIGLPDQSGLEVLRVLKKSHPELPVLILTMYPEDQFAQFCLRAGAAGFLSKSNASSHLVEAIRKAALNGRGVPGGILKTRKSKVPPVKLHETLSGREFQIFCQIASGRTQKAIASQLKLSPRQVSASRANILKLMDMAGDADIVRYVAENNLCS